MNYLKMKARTHDNSWFVFDISNIPTMFSEHEFALLSRPGTPILNKDIIRRGDNKTKLFEGDIVRMDGNIWLCCYERGFYLINENYQYRYFDSLSDFDIIGDYYEDGFKLNLQSKARHIFKYKDIHFRIEDIIGGTNDNKLFIRGVNRPCAIYNIQQECAIKVDNQSIFFGDRLNDYVITLHDGRIMKKDSDNNYIDFLPRRGVTE